METDKEIERIKKVYERRKEKIPSHFYSLFNPGNFFIVQRREWEIIKILKRYGITSLEDKKILDVGCGTGGELRNLVHYGARPENLFGIDLLQDRIAEAKKISPNIDFRCGDASELPYENESFDTVMQFTLFTSVLDMQMKRNIAKEMLRVLKPNGIIVWYDYHMGNPKNPDVRGIRKREVHELFQGCEIFLKRITLAPPITRIMAPYSWLVCYFVEKLKVFNTHYIGVIKKS